MHTNARFQAKALPGNPQFPFNISMDVKTVSVMIYLHIGGGGGVLGGGGSVSHSRYIGDP